MGCGASSSSRYKAQPYTPQAKTICDEVWCERKVERVTATDRERYSPREDTSRSTSDVSIMSLPAGPPPFKVIYDEIRSSADVITSARRHGCFCAFGLASSVAEGPKEEKHSVSSDPCHGPPADMRSRMAVTCRRGQRLDAVPNQDNFLYTHFDQFTLFGIVDGHGSGGHFVSQWVALYLLAFLIPELFGARKARLPDHYTLRRAFNIAHEALCLRADAENFDVSLSGCFVTLCFVDHINRTVVSAWVGDCKCILGEHKAPGVVEASEDGSVRSDFELLQSLTADRDIREVEGRCARVCEAACKVARPSSWRSLGDVILHQSYGATHTPDRKCVFCRSGMEFIICCSDGVWEYLSTEEAIELVGSAGKEFPEQAVQSLADAVEAAWEEELDDDDEAEDFTAIVLWI
eukprot:TRINITY_DN54646_c0_g1_i1.p1 TRINITY_DN54646_c0_g1~~TRINITY_DN54646_c0_g1_i1.p1  ORF type:complete len:406 (-),score=57.37 TRINITY_DN54646_c0_g1_i1:27-1244(-)